MFRPEPDQPPEDLPDPTSTRDANQLELLALCEQFLRTASPTVHKELNDFLTAHGHHHLAALPAFLDQLAFTSARPTTTLGGAE